MGDRAELLAIGDVHLGTSPSGVPSSVASWGVDPDGLTPAAALGLAVDFAIAQRVDAVLFAGDVVESTNARFEAMPPLEAGLRRLFEEGIQVVAVAGNHDVEALPRVTALVEGFDLLGAGGTWESRTVAKNGAPVAEIVGWSFGERHVRESPVARLLAKPLEPLPVPVPCIGLLHADLDASGGSYAPVRQVELNDTGYAAWLLGHIHKPSLERLSAPAGGPPSGYLGSLVGLDPSETGPHGPWCVRVGDDGGVRLEQVALAPLRWENISVSVDGLEHPDDVGDRLLTQAEETVRRIGSSGWLPRALGLRARLTGRSPCHEGIGKKLASGAWNDLGRMVDGTAVFVSKIVASIRPQLDLPEIARGDDPAALLARRLILLEEGGDGVLELLKEARGALATTANDEIWAPASDHRSHVDPLSDDALRDVLMQSGMEALTAMLSQNAPGRPA